MVQRFPQLQGVDQCLAVSVFLIKPAQAFTSDQESGNPLAVTFHPDPGQVPAIAQEKRPTEDVRDLKDMLVHSILLLPQATA